MAHLGLNLLGFNTTGNPIPGGANDAQGNGGAAGGTAGGNPATGAGAAGGGAGGALPGGAGGGGAGGAGAGTGGAGAGAGAGAAGGADPGAGQLPNPDLVAALQARLVELEAQHAAALHRLANPQANPMVASPEEIDRVRALAAVDRDSRKPVSLPPLIAGFKSSALDLPVPPKVDDALRTYKYIPYTALSHTARLRSSRGEEDFVVNASGGLTAKGLDRKDEHSISFVDWLATSHTVEQRIMQYHGKARGDAFHSHHRVVSDLHLHHGWEVALLYDIEQREAAANHQQHDLTGLNMEALTLITTRLLARRHYNPPPPAYPASSKRARASEDEPSAVNKRAAQRCFRCGSGSHLPIHCEGTVTSAGRVPAALARDAKHPNALLAADGRVYCFNWAKGSSCSFGNACANFHGCSLCGSVNHGAADCP